MTVTSQRRSERTPHQSSSSFNSTENIPRLQKARRTAETPLVKGRRQSSPKASENSKQRSRKSALRITFVVSKLPPPDVWGWARRQPSRQPGDDRVDDLGPFAGVAGREEGLCRAKCRRGCSVARVLTHVKRMCGCGSCPVGLYWFWPCDGIILVGMAIPAIRVLGSFTARRMRALPGGAVWALGCCVLGSAG